ncbi:hypothetical protein NDI56_06655 [Haloarcula sp. S1CR25-12]|uniref:Uncharacterized protein n=1 Tax=Haloarcula saliterrae TaxID=2950534 RepID=A0ABU2F9Z5_9EURY|nr:hypothetical protein [Haloarcula sp. S1CR25-12]MDS0259069.1 hypothetical protein [Haloarcula sp. S1CR25-12]
MNSNHATCPGCEATITAEKDVEFIQIEKEEPPLLSASGIKKMYVIACGSCEAILGGGVGMPS